MSKQVFNKEYPNMSEEYNSDHYYDQLKALGRSSNKKSRSTLMSWFYMLICGAFLVVPTVVNIDFLSFIRGAVLISLVLVFPLMMYFIVNKDVFLAKYLKDEDYKQILAIVGSRSTVFSNSICVPFLLIALYSGYLIWLTPFFLWLNYPAAMIVVYSGIVCLLPNKDKNDVRTCINKAIAENDMDMKTLYEKASEWYFANCD